MDVELLEVLLVVGVPNVYHGVAGLGQSRIQNVVVRRRLVGETFAVQVDLFPFPPYRLRMAFPLAGGHRVCGARHSFAVGLLVGDCSGNSLIADFVCFPREPRVLRFVSFAAVSISRIATKNENAK